MKTFKYLLFTFFILGNYTFAQENYQPLFKIYENGLYGYIDSTGKVVIPPKYKGAGEFSEGLAPVRENGYYGYIDEAGKYYINPQYDYAESFLYGHAVIYNDGKAGLLDRTGRMLIPFKYRNIDLIKNGRALVKTFKFKQGIADNKGILVIDTLYFGLKEFSEGIITVFKQRPKEWQNDVAGIDSTGKIVIPFGKFNSIGPFRNGFAKVRWTEGDKFNTFWGYVNNNGELLFSMKDSDGWQSSDYVTKEGVFIAKYNPYATQNNAIWVSRVIYGNLMKLNGELIKNDTINREYVFFNNDLCIVDSFGRYKTLNQSFDPDGNYFFTDNNKNKFYYKFKDSAGVYGLIDTALQFTVNPSYEEPMFSLNNDYFNYLEKDLYQFCGNNISIRPVSIGVDHKGMGIKLINGLLFFKSEKCNGYINKNGKIVWLQSQNKEMHHVINIDYQITNNYRIDESYSWRPESTGSIDTLDKEITNEEFQLLIDDKEKTDFLQYFEGITLYIINNSQNANSSSSEDACLPLVLQAKDKNGKWRDIENNERMFDVGGESYIRFKANTFWKFAIPVYNGGFKTKLRAKMTIIDNNLQHKNIYSNTIDGSINPAQFWRDIDLLNINDLFDKGKF